MMDWRARRVSWYGPDYLAVAMRDPQWIYNRLFTIKAAHPECRVTDLVLSDARSMAKQLGSADRNRLGE